MFLFGQSEVCRLSITASTAIVAALAVFAPAVAVSIDSVADLAFITMIITEAHPFDVAMSRSRDPQLQVGEN